MWNTVVSQTSSVSSENKIIREYEHVNGEGVLQNYPISIMLIKKD